MRDFRREVSAASDFSTEFPETEFSWSLTRHLRFLRCERAYFLHYYAAQGGWDGWADPVISAIYRGKKAKLYAEWLGELMDAAWKAVLDRVRFIPEPMRARAFRRRLEELLFARMTERVREAAESPDYIPFPDFELPPDDLFRKARHDLAEALEFAFSTQYPSAILHFQRPNRINRNADYEAWFGEIRIWSNPGIFWSEPGMRCSLRLSFCEPEPSIFQACADIFAWYIRTLFHEENACSTFLAAERGEWKGFEYSGNADRAEELIAGSVAMMRAKIRPGRVVYFADFPECGVPEICRCCRFGLACSFFREADEE